MAQDFAAGDPAAALTQVFPPLHPLLLSFLGPIVGSGNASWWVSGQGLCIFLGVLSVVLLWRVSALFVTGPATALVPAIASFWLAVGMLPAWNAADALSEGLFLVLLCAWMLAWASDRRWLVSILAGLCFLTRPEGGILFAPLLWRLYRSPDRAATAGRRWAEGFCMVLVGALLPILYLVAKARLSGGFDPLPVGSFMHELSVFSQPDPGSMMLAYAHNLLRFLEQGFDGLGYLAYPCFFLALFGLRSLDASQGRRILPLVLVACIACLVAPLFKSNRRFWISWLPILLPLAARPLCRLQSWRPHARLGGSRALWLLVLVLALPHLVRLPRQRRSALLADRQLGRWLVAQGLQPGELAADLPRLLFFADQPPLPPRHLEAARLMEQAARPQTRYVASLRSRDKLDLPRLKKLGYKQMDLGTLLPTAQLRPELVFYARH